MPTAHVTVKYEGGVVQHGHSMDAREFGSSLISLADAYNRAAQLLIDAKAERPHVRIEGVGQGSFRFELMLADPGWAQTLMGLLLSQPVQAVNAATEIGVAVAGALRALLPSCTLRVT